METMRRGRETEREREGAEGEEDDIHLLTTISATGVIDIDINVDERKRETLPRENSSPTRSGR